MKKWCNVCGERVRWYHEEFRQLDGTSRGTHRRCSEVYFRAISDASNALGLTVEHVFSEIRRVNKLLGEMLKRHS